MERARAAAAVALFALLLAATAALAVAAPTLRSSAPVPAAIVGWPPATLVVTEIQTGGASASDEFAEIGNMGSTPVDLAGLEIVYVTSTGGTVTRKAAWTEPLLLEPGRHLVIANATGAYLLVADATYSGGFAATGGAVVLRVIGGAPIDAIGWGDATNEFVEGVAAPAPPAGSSLERRPGGTAGNTTDTNDNLADSFVQAIPNPQNLAAPPVPAPGPTSTPTPETPTPTPAASDPPSPEPSPLPSMSSEPTADPATPEPTASPSATAEPPPSPTPSPTPGPTPSPTPELTPSSSPGLTPSPSPEPSPMPTTSLVPIASARTLANGTAVTVEGIVTTALGALESGRAGFVQDESAGIAIYLDAAVTDPIQAGTVVRVAGTIDERYGARTIRASAGDVIELEHVPVPLPEAYITGAVGEAAEGWRVTVIGTTIGSPTSYADGLGILVDDGSGEIRVIVGPVALDGASLPAGTRVQATGPVGQRDSTGTGTGGYRIHATEFGELEVLPIPSPSPIPTPTPSPTPTATPGPTPSPTPTPTPTPAPTATPAPSGSPALLAIGDARARPVGAVVTVRGVITAEAGRVGTPALIAIADETGGILVRIPGEAPAATRGAVVAVTGSLAAPYGQLEVRPASSGFAVVGGDVLPWPLDIVAADLGEATEARLVSIVGTAAGSPRRSSSGDLTIDLVDPTGRPFRVMADSSSGVTSTDVRAGTTYRFTGVVGQRASKKGALDGYRVWIRDRADIAAGPSGAAGASPSPTAGTASDVVIAIAEARRLDDAPASIEGTVTAGSGLLDDDGRRIVLQDDTGGIEVLLPADAGPVASGTRFRAVGTVGRAWDAPRLRALEVTFLGAGPDVAPRILTGEPGEAVEWQLVRIAGTITDVTRLGDRWRADVRVGSARVLVTGLAGAGIASTSLLEGRAVTVVGIVRRPYPTATDRRWSVVPRGPWDVAVGPALGGGDPERTGGSGGGGDSAGKGSAAGTAPARFADVPTVDLATLDEHRGELVRIGGLVVARTSAGFTIDDGTAVGSVALRGETAAFLELIEAGDALGIVGRVELTPSGELLVAATDPAGLVRLGSLGETVPLLAGAAVSSSPEPSRGNPAEAGLTEPFADIDGGWLGLAGVAIASLGSVILTVARRRRVHLGLRRLVANRMAGIGAPKPPRGAA